MLARINRLNKQKDFQLVLTKGRGHQDDWLLIKQKRRHSAPYRFGLIISGKVDRRAVVRNRLRRQLSEIVRKNLNIIKPGFDVVLVVKAAGRSASFQTLEGSLLGLLKKARIID